jgi:sugar-specific transcriptional regulator TrmB
MSDVIAKLMKLGLREYEARVYAALLGLGEGTARQVHDASGVPRPRVYDVLEELAKNGFVEVRQGTPTCYKALEPSLVVSRLKEDIVTAADEVVRDLEESRLGTVERISPIWYARGEWSMRSKLEDLIGRASKELVMLWYDTSLLKGIAERVREASHEKTIVCLVVDGGRELIGRLGNTDLREVVELDLLKELFQDKTFNGRIKTDGVEYRLKCLAVADSKEAVLVYEANAEKMAVTIRLPIITFIQRAFLGGLISSSNELV